MEKRSVCQKAVRMRLARQRAKAAGQEVKVKKVAFMGWAGRASQKAKEKGGHMIIKYPASVHIFLIVSSNFYHF